MQSAKGSWWKLTVACLVAALLFVGCGDDEETNHTDDTNTADATSDTSTNPADGIVASGDTTTYRLIALELTAPQISLRGILNALIKVNIDAEPGEAERVNVLLQFADWDLAASPIALSLGGGAGEEVPDGANVAYRFRADAGPAFVPAEVRSVEGLSKIQHDQPTSLTFPVIVGASTFMMPLENILLETCYGTNPRCEGADEHRIYGTLTGGIKVSEADGILVETSTVTLPLGDLLRDADTSSTCAVATDCGTDMACNADGNCERAPDLEIDGEPGFYMAGKFVGETVTFVE